MKFLAVALPALFLASAAYGAELDASSTAGGPEAAAPAEPSAPATTEEAADEEREICRRVETNTGSRVPFRRVCMTERQWRSYNRQN